ncbi:MULTISPECIES: CGNR zinc finger domain-containing protein [Nocardiaceae]|uniref:CGNR zinc finger domain-containing protein n=1 Tax=Nocardiaceae TaxID=85025 RepID=UPI000AE95A11|nr:MULTISPECIES: ABATE domain-containing protein [Rhodococcus]
MSRPPVVETKDQRRLGFPFRSGSLALDFVATVAKRDMNERELLVDSDALHTWIFVAGLPPALDPITPDRLEDAIALREALNHLTRSRVDGSRPAPAAIDTINRAASYGPPPLLLAYDAANSHFGGSVDVRNVLSIVARDAVDLYSGPYRDRIRRCLGHECSLYFVDRSRQGNRRWCSMAACGEKASSAAYRERARHN